MKILNGMRLIWAARVARSLAMMWLNIALIQIFTTYNAIAKTRRSELIFAGGILFSVALQVVYYWRVIRPQIVAATAVLAEVEDRAPVPAPMPETRRIERGGFGREGSR